MTGIAPGGASGIFQVPLFQGISTALPLHQSVNCTAVWNTAHSWMPRIGKYSQDPPEPLLFRLSAYRMLLAQFVTRTAVAFAVTLHGFTEPVLKFLYGVLAWSSFSHFLPCLLYPLDFVHCRFEIVIPATKVLHASLREIPLLLHLHLDALPIAQINLA